MKKISKVVYQVEMRNKRKRLWNFHITRKWHEQLATSYWVEDMEEKEELHLWNEEEEQSHEIADQLTEEQGAELRHLLEQYKGTLQDKPGLTQVAEHTSPGAVQGYPAGQTRTDTGSRTHNRYRNCNASETTTLQITVCVQGQGAEEA